MGRGVILRGRDRELEEILKDSFLELSGKFDRLEEYIRKFDEE